MDTILIVEDSKTFGSLLTRLVERELGCTCVWAKSRAACEAALEAMEQPFAVALTDLNLPDAPNGEVVDLVLAKGVPTIVFTGELNDELRDFIWSKHIVDYVLKQSMQNVSYVTALLKRLLRNRGLKALVVDDSRLARHRVGDLLKAHGYTVFEAENGASALSVLAREPGIKLVVTDFFMPDMDGAALTKAIRLKADKDEVAIIGISGQGNTGTSVQMLKSGANDYLNKGFQAEEFYCRISQNIDMLNMIEDISNMANRDFLTGLYNRKFLFETGEKLFANQKRENLRLTVGMMDIDFFKKINDTYGHDVGDAVLKHFASLMRSRFRQTDVVSRYGGEEFCILNVNLNAADAFTLYDDFRREVARTRTVHHGQEIAFTVSIGVSTVEGANFEECIKAADALLYRSKQDGRDRVTVV